MTGLMRTKSKTEGIRITNWSLPVGKDTFRLNVWDFGGQEIMHATHQFFMTERSLYLLVLNGREGGEDLDAEYWLKHVQSFGGKSPVIVVLNKIAQQPFDLNYKSLQAGVILRFAALLKPTAGKGPAWPICAKGSSR